MYNSKSIIDFINKVNKEAEEQAQKVYDKYNEELLRRIQNQLKEGDIVWAGNGCASIENKSGDDIGENLANVLGDIQYWNRNVDAGFNLPYKFNKIEILSK